MKKITISKEDYDNILDAWAKTNVLCAYLANPKCFDQDFSAKDQVEKIYKHLDSVAANLPDFEEYE